MNYVHAARTRRDRVKTMIASLQQQLVQVESDCHAAETNSMNAVCRERLHHWWRRESHKPHAVEQALSKPQLQFLESLKVDAGQDPWLECKAHEWPLACGLAAVGLIEVDEEINAPRCSATEFSARLKEPAKTGA